MDSLDFLTLENLHAAAIDPHGTLAKWLISNPCPIVDDHRAHFFYHGRADQVFLQHWVYGLPSRIPLTRLGTSEWWYANLELPLQSRVEYKFVAIIDGHEHWHLDSRNPRMARDPFGGNSVVHMTGYEEPTWSLLDPNVPQGTLESFTLWSQALGSPREVRVYLPARFRANRRHRLLIMHDGDDYMRYSRLGVIMDNLTQGLEIPPLVLVLLNPHDRLKEYGADRRHATFVVEELLPEIERRYPVIPEASARCLGGASFGGVASLATAWHYPGVFDLLLLQSGSFAFTDIGRHSRGPIFDPVVAFMNSFRASIGLPTKKIYLSCGVFESLIYENRSLVPQLQAAGMEVLFEEARDGHNWENWRDRLRNAFTWLFPVPLWFYYE